jgi:uncharacterized repeat protein (TIGR03803 family)
MRRRTSFAILGIAGSCVAGLAAAPAMAQGSLLTTLYNFCADGSCTNGSFNYPAGGGSLVQGVNGTLYGTIYAGGAYGYGTVFKITRTGTQTTLYNFCASSGCPDGSYPNFGLARAASGELYGTASQGGAYGNGTVFKIAQNGTLTTLYSFCTSSACPDGSGPQAGLVQANDGNFYGTTTGGGASGAGTVFKITPAGALTTLYSFTGGSDGSSPWATLVQAADGRLYGTTYSNGAYNNGTIFRITKSGTLTTLYNFNGTDGGASQAGLMQAADGDLYGTSKFGGAASSGTIFKITTSGALTTLYTFSGPDGTWPNSALIQATDGNLYGTTEIGGTASSGSGGGTIFKIVPDGGALTSLYSFPAILWGGTNNVYAGLLQATDGQFYGVTNNDGTAGDGTVFSFCAGLCPFVETSKPSGPVGAAVSILGTDLADAVGVTFNGTAASFVAASNSEIKTTVPAGATTGTVQVTMPNRTLSSNLVFNVVP